MHASSQPFADLARKNERSILSALAKHSQARIAEQMGVNDSTVSRLKDGPIEQLCLLMAACGLKCISTEMQCFSRDKVHALLTLARDHLVQMEHPDELNWES